MFPMVLCALGFLSFLPTPNLDMILTASYNMIVIILGTGGQTYESVIDQNDC